MLTLTYYILITLKKQIQNRYDSRYCFEIIYYNNNMFIGGTRLVQNTTMKKRKLYIIFR